MAHDAFISHARQDKPIADAVCATLEQEEIRCWIAPRDIIPGADWGTALVDAIRECRVMILVLSAAANNSPHIRREVERAVHMGIPVLPLRIEDVLPDGALEYHLGTVHWLDAITPPLEAHLKRLADTVRTIINGPGAARERQFRAPPRQEAPRPQAEPRVPPPEPRVPPPETRSPAPEQQAPLPPPPSPPPPPPPRPPEAERPEPVVAPPPLRKVPVLACMLLTTGTLGMYVPYWYLTRSNELNALPTQEKLTPAAPTAALVLLVAYFVFLVAGVVMVALATSEGTDPAVGGGLIFVGVMAGLAGWGVLLALAFKVSRMLTHGLGQRLLAAGPMSGLATFLFHVLYLQYRINKLPADANVGAAFQKSSRGAVGAAVVAAAAVLLLAVIPPSDEGAPYYPGPFADSSYQSVDSSTMTRPLPEPLPPPPAIDPPSGLAAELVVANLCHKPIIIGINHRTAAGSWRTDRWYEIAAGGRTTLASGNDVVRTREDFYYYAASTDEQTFWSGTATDASPPKRLQLDGRTYSFRAVNLPAGDDGSRTLELTCDDPVTPPPPPPPVDPPQDLTAELLVENACTKPVLIGVHHRAPDGQWRTDRWYEIAVGARLTLTSDEKRVRTREQFYYYAASTDGQTFWNGTDQDASPPKRLELDGRSYMFRAVSLPVGSDGYRTLKLTCN